MGTDFYRFDQFLTPVPKLNIDCFGCSKPVFTLRGSGRAKKMVITLTHSSAKILAFHKYDKFVCNIFKELYLTDRSWHLFQVVHVFT